MEHCKKCGRELTNDEIGIHRRMMNRGDSEFFCLTCLAEFFECDEQLLRDKIEHFRKMGCMLFEPHSGNSECK